jgi:tripartite-type tricarboxylate transporter receptor subunit TctC
MKTLNRRIALALATVALPLFLSAPARADAYPDKPIHLIVPYTAGGSTDVLARVLAEYVRKSLGQPVVVENKPGANTAIGAQTVATAAPDGYTLLLATGSTIVTNPLLYAKLSYNAERDFTPVARVAISPLVLTANPGLPATNFSEFVKLARAQPGKLNYTSPGPGSVMHLAMLLLAKQAGLDMVHVPFKGSSPALTATMAGDAQLCMDAVTSALPLVKSGKLRALAVSTPERLKALPDVPSVAEGGFPGFDASAWYGIMAPARTPPDAIAKLHRAISAAMSDPAFRDRFDALGLSIPAPITPAAFADTIRAERERWTPIVRNNKLSLDQ